MDIDKYALPPDVLYEIKKITYEEWQEKKRKLWEHEQMIAAKRERASAGQGARSRSPARSSSRTPSPKNKGTGKGKLKSKNAVPTPAESIAASPAVADSIEGNDSRQRDHTSGQEEHSDTEVIAPPPAADAANDGQVNDNDNGINNNEHDDGLVDFGSPAEEVKMETEEPTEQGEVEESATPAASSEYHMVTEANVEQNTIIDVS